MKRIMVVEDDENIRRLLEVALEGYQYEVVSFEDALSALSFLKSDHADCAVFDWMLPGMDGLSAIKEIRKDERTKNLPIIMLTAKSSEFDKISGLDQGADDYLTKPFSVLELAARIRSLLRRTSHEENKMLSSGALVIDKDTRTLTVDGKKIELTYKEFDLLWILMENRQRVVSREELFKKVWGSDFIGETRTLDIHIATLRSKLKEPYNEMIKTVRGVGYRFMKGE